MNLTSIDGGPSRAIADIVRAENSPRVRAYFEYASKRYCDSCREDCFPVETDQDGNQFVNSDGFTVSGQVAMVLEMWRYFWRRIATGEFGLNPQRLFAVAVQPRTPQTSAIAQTSSSPSNGGQNRTT